MSYHLGNKLFEIEDHRHFITIKLFFLIFYLKEPHSSIKWVTSIGNKGNSLSLSLIWIDKIHGLSYSVGLALWVGGYWGHGKGGWCFWVGQGYEVC